MAQRVQIILEDDYDGGTAVETVSFALDGAEYEIDLSAKMPLVCVTHWRLGWAMHARRAAGESGPASRPVRQAPVTSGLGPRQMATTSAVAAGFPPMSEAYEKAHA